MSDTCELCGTETNWIGPVAGEGPLFTDDTEEGNANLNALLQYLAGEGPGYERLRYKMACRKCWEESE